MNRAEETKYEVFIKAKGGESFLPDDVPRMVEVFFEADDTFVLDFRLDVESVRKSLLDKMIEKGFDFSVEASDIKKIRDHKKNTVVFSQMVSEEHLEKSKKRHI